MSEQALDVTAAQRSLPVVLRDALKTDQLQLLHGRVVRLADRARVTVEIADQEVTVPKLAVYQPAPNDSVYLLADSQQTIAVGAVTGTGGGVPGQIPVGGVIQWMTPNAPVGWLLCNGSAFNTVTYQELFGVLGTNVLPDLRRRVPVGAGSGMGVGANDGLGEGARHVLHYHNVSGSTNTTGSHQHPGVGDHQHIPDHPTLAFPETNRLGAAAQGTFAFAGNNYSDRTGPAGAHQHGAAGDHAHTVSGSTSGGGPLNGPAYIVVNFIIRAL